MKIIDDEAEAFNILEQFGAAEFDFTKQQVRFLRSPEQLVFFLFCPEGISKGAHVFVLVNPPAPGEIETELLSAVMKFDGDEASDSLRENAVEVLRNYIENKNAGHYFFDAH